MADDDIQRLLRELAPRALGVMVRRYRDFARCEDAVQEALVAAVEQWLSAGLPDRPLGWLIHVASRRLTDEVRGAAARRLREQLVVSLVPADEQIALAADEAHCERDDTFDLFFTCCHPSLSLASQIALTLRAVGGLTTSEIARAFMVPEATMAQRLTRAKQTIKASGGRFPAPSPEERGERLSAVLHVLYLVFSEGYAATSGLSVVRIDLSDEAIRVTRMLSALAPEEPEIAGLLALMLLTDARRAARSTPQGDLVPLDEQDRTRWDRARVAEGTALIDRTMSRGSVGPYQLQAAIAALHDAAADSDTTDWAQILALYDALLGMADTPMVRLSRAIALAMVEGPEIGLGALDALALDSRLRDSHRLDAARAHLLERTGRLAAAIEGYRRAADRTASAPERSYLLLRAARLVEPE